MHWELRSINCYEFVGYFWATARTLVQKNLVLRWRHLYRVLPTVTNVVQGKRSQWWKFTWPPQSKILATPMSHSAWSVTTLCTGVWRCGKRWGGGIVKRVFHSVCSILLKIHFENIWTKWWHSHSHFSQDAVHLNNLTVKKVKVAHTRLPSVGFRS